MVIQVNTIEPRVNTKQIHLLYYKSENHVIL